jgi:hypothetical protein
MNPPEGTSSAALCWIEGFAIDSVLYASVWETGCVSFRAPTQSIVQNEWGYSIVV